MLVIGNVVRGLGGIKGGQIVAVDIEEVVVIEGVLTPRVVDRGVVDGEITFGLMLFSNLSLVLGVGRQLKESAV